jgi:hypothetical protein
MSHGLAGALFAHGVTHTAHIIELGLHTVEALMGETAVGFELGFTFTTRRAATTASSTAPT